MVDEGNGDGIARRQFLGSAAAGAFGTAAAAGASGTTAADPGDEHYHNPVGPVGFGDVTAVQAEDGNYYAYGTETPLDVVPIARSENLVDWTYVTAAFDSSPDWRDNPDAGVWAPDVNYVDGEYRLYYSYSTWGSQNNPGIGLATADSPTGPFTDQGPVFRGEDLGMTNAIDADLVVEDGTPYLIWGSFFGIYGVQLTQDGSDYVPGTTFHVAGDNREGPTVVRENGYYYLFLSTGQCCEGADSTYEVEVGRAESLTGPYYAPDGRDLREIDEHHAGATVLTGTDRFIGPGHNGAVQDEAGNWWMLYHVEATADREDRVMMLDRIRFDDDGWPVVGCDGTPCPESPRPVMDPQSTPRDDQTPTTPEDQGPPAIGGGAAPTDPDGDGLYEDLNGNGEVDYSDVVSYFETMDDPAMTDNVAAYDYNGNGEVDFADLVDLFEQV
ncbi:family 43 glycosylhydrolase [Halomicrobium salinisoli]|uniref:family 43 glycosylhydrolase n=1 Tax=Halomicrobium salinisoli TaxID=2878391 RepID=UPI001CF08E85|nr:family 43 glycosylhydrolase [Halomicrobium salinisoli]